MRIITHTVKPRLEGPLAAQLRTARELTGDRVGARAAMRLALEAAAGHGGVHDAASAGPQAHIFIQLAQAGNGFIGVEGSVRQGGLHELLGQLAYRWSR